MMIMMMMNAGMMEIGCEGDDDEVPTVLLQKYQLGKLLFKQNDLTVRRCEDRYVQILRSYAATVVSW